MSVVSLKSRLGDRTQGVHGRGTQALQGKSMRGHGMQGAGVHNDVHVLNASPANPNLPNPDAGNMNPATALGLPATDPVNPNLSNPNPANANPAILPSPDGVNPSATEPSSLNLSNPDIVNDDTGTDDSRSVGLDNPAAGANIPDGAIPVNSTLDADNPDGIVSDADNPSGVATDINSPEATASNITASDTSKPPDPINPPAIIQSNYLALTTNAIDIITENLKNQPLSYQMFDVVKAPTGGTTAFTIPGLSGDEIAKELTGIILDYTTPRAYWETPEPVEGTPPSCYSLDSVVSVEGKACGTCLYNTFGSKNNGIVNGISNGAGVTNGNHGKDSNAKACKESVQALLLLPDSVIPIIVRIPVTSKIIFQKYMARLVSRMIPLCGVVTKITLEKATSNGGQPYAKFNFEAVEMLSLEETNYARAYGQKFSEMLGASVDMMDSPAEMLGASYGVLDGDGAYDGVDGYNAQDAQDA